MHKRVFIAGGAGFVGSHFVDRFLSVPATERVTVFDNFSSGTKGHLAHHNDKRLQVVEGEIGDGKALTDAMGDHDTVIHLASNPDIAKAVTDPTVDFVQGTALTQQVVEAMRKTGAKRILYASGSGIYGDAKEHELAEDYGPLEPISTYGASKLAGEALISAYCYMFDMTGVAFRWGNVVGPRQTHGVGFDFIRKLRKDPKSLDILGDGTQSKSYVYISDIINAVLLASEKTTKRYDVFNVATGDYITVKEIAQIAVEEQLGKDAKVEFKFTGGDRGWKGDVPIVRIGIAKISALGWKPQYSSGEAMRKAIRDMLADESKCLSSPHS
jgi:UDP-glucose 4-epimerase